MTGDWPLAAGQRAMKKVQFSETLEINQMFAWSFAYKKSRDGMQWIHCAVDRERFKARILQIECVLKPILENKIMVQIKIKHYDGGASLANSLDIVNETIDYLQSHKPEQI